MTCQNLFNCKLYPVLPCTNWILNISKSHIISCTTITNYFPFGITLSLSVSLHDIYPLPLGTLIWHLVSGVWAMLRMDLRWHVVRRVLLLLWFAGHECQSGNQFQTHSLNEQKHKSGKPQFRYLKNWYQWHLVSIEERIYLAILRKKIMVSRDFLKYCNSFRNL